MKEKILEKKEIRIEYTIKEIIHDAEQPTEPTKTTDCIKTISFSDCSWKEFINITRAGRVRDFFKVSEKKEITLKNGEKVKIAIAGFDHDISETGETLPITLTFVDSLAEGYFMNAMATNKGGWKDCTMRKKTMQEIFNLLPDELQAIIVASKKDGETIDKLFLPSEIEVFGKTVYSEDKDNKQYDFYKDKYNRIKFRTDDEDDSGWWWLRSPYSGGSIDFCMVGSNGNAGNYDASDTSGVSPCFAIGIGWTREELIADRGFKEEDFE